MSEWLRRQTWNLLGFARAGSIPAVDAFLFLSILNEKFGISPAEKVDYYLHIKDKMVSLTQFGEEFEPTKLQ